MVFRLMLVLSVLVVGALWSVPTFADISTMRAADCDVRYDDGSEKVECWLELVLAPAREGDVRRAYDVFAFLYDTYPYFGAVGCHPHAHRIGDVTYYEFFLKRGAALEHTEFPQETVSCGYGFWHGFIEHLVQSRPDPTFVTETCEYLRSRYAATMRDIGTICYHASGHGFLRAHIDTMPRSEWGDIRAVATPSLRACEALPQASEREKKDCREGVFNVVVDWKLAEDFGFSFDYEDPFSDCDLFPWDWRHACYYEFSMHLGPVVGFEPMRAASFVERIQDGTLREMAFGTAIASMMQATTPLGEHETIADGCLQIEDAPLRIVCIRSVVGGMMEHGPPGREYEGALAVCELVGGADADAGRECYLALEWRLERFYPPEKTRSICARFPETYRHVCSLAG